MTTTTVTPILDYVAPEDLICDPNIRTKTRLDDDFLASIREHGVIHPIIGYQSDGTQVHVLMGQRRALAAKQVGLDQVLTVIWPSRSDAHAATETDRIVSQWAENEHRAGLSLSEQMHAVHQLALTGLEDDAIADLLVTPTPDVARLRAAAASEIAAARAAEQPITITQAAALAEFDEDANAVRQIEAAIDEGRSTDHVVATLRATRERNEKLAAAEAKLKKAGHKNIVSTSPGVPLDGLVDEETGKQITPANHRKCPGDAVQVYTYAGGREPIIRHGCTDPDQYGHVEKIDAAAAARAAVVDEEIRRHTEQLEQWETATGVRRQWILDHLANATKPPKGAPEFLARYCSHLLADDPLPNPIEQLAILGHPYAEGEDLDARYARFDEVLNRRCSTGTDQAKLAFATAAAIADLEVVAGHDRHSAECRAVLNALASWGYQLSDIETEVLDRAEDVDDE